MSQEVNFAELERQLAEAPTKLQIQRSAQAHVAYGWSRRPWGNWSDEQKEIYNEAYDKASNNL